MVIKVDCALATMPAGREECICDQEILYWIELRCGSYSETLGPLCLRTSTSLPVPTMCCWAPTFPPQNS